MEKFARERSWLSRGGTLQEFAYRGLRKSRKHLSKAARCPG